MQDFIDYMKNAKGKADNTLIAYRRDIEAFMNFLSGRGIEDLDSCSEGDAVAFIFDMNRAMKSKATINRRISSLRQFFDYCIEEGRRQNNPFDKIRAFKAGARAVDYLTVEETAGLIGIPDDSPKGLRDRALLEFMYGTGARVTEVVRLRFSDINLRMSFVTLRDVKDESRIVPLGSYAKSALREYMRGSYSYLSDRAPEDEAPVFVNLRGETLTRQGIWRILKTYGAEIGVEERMTPQILRDTYAVHILQNGGDLRTLQELMGFEDISAGLPYLSVIKKSVRDVFSRTHPRA